MMRLLLAVALMLFSLPAQARDWQLVAGNALMRTYVDTESIERSGGMATASVLNTFRDPIGQIYALELKMVYDCTQMRFRELDGINYSATGEILGRDPATEPDKYYPTEPNSLDEGGRQYACFGNHGVASIADPFADAGAAFGWKP